MKRLLALASAALLCLTLLPSAQANTFRLAYDAEGTDPAETFEADCLGDTQAEDCDVRAALIEADLVLLLARLQNDSDPQTLALFEQALELDSPIVQQMATQYVAAAGEQPQDFLSKLKTFFFGPDAPLGTGAAKVLESSPDPAEQELADLYGEARDRTQYAPQAAPADGEDSELVKACVKDARLNLMTSFTNEEQFEPATRLLMYDRFVFDTTSPTDDYPATAFVTDASLEEVSAFFTGLFGEPYGPYAGVETKMQELTMQLITLQQAAASGDQNAIKKLTQAAEQLTELQKTFALATTLQVPNIHAENDLVWLDGSLDDLAAGPLRAVTAGEDAALGQTVIRYINAPPGSASQTPGNGNGGESATPGGDAGGGANEGGAGADRAVRKADEGCGCAVPRGSAPSASLAALALLAWGLRRRTGERTSPGYSR